MVAFGVMLWAGAILIALSDAEDWECSGRFMGPECVQVNAAFDPKEQLGDGDINTCSELPDQQFEIKFSNIPSFIFTWMFITWESERAAVRMKGYFGEEEVEMRRRYSRYEVTNTSHIYHGEFKKGITKLTLEILRNLRICEIQVSQGRNLALDQEVSLVDDDLWLQSESKEIVDGNPETCLEFYVENSTQSVGLQLNGTASIWRWDFTTKKEDDLNCGMRYFKVETWKDDSEGPTFEQTHDEDWFKKARTLSHILPEYEDVSKLVVSQPLKPSEEYGCSEGLNIYLTICELSVYGESICPDGKWGKYCDRKCHCLKDNKCSAATGYCPKTGGSATVSHHTALTIVAVVVWCLMVST